MNPSGPLRLCVFAFQMPFGCGYAALGLCSANLQTRCILRRFSGGQNGGFSTFEKIATIAFCPLRLCVFAFQLPFGCGRKPRWAERVESSEMHDTL
jgi:hypothetical protein